MQALCLDARILPLLLRRPDLLLHHDAALERHVVFRLQILQRRGRVPSLSLEIIIGDLNVSQLELQGPVVIPKRRDFLLQGVLRAIGLGPGLLVF